MRRKYCKQTPVSSIFYYTMTLTLNYDLELWPFDPRIGRVPLCHNVHHCCKFGENPSSTFQDITLTVADSEEGQWGRLPPIGYWSRLHDAVCLRLVGEFSFKSLTSGPFCMKMGQKAFSFRRASPLTPSRGSALDSTGGSTPRPLL